MLNNLNFNVNNSTNNFAQPLVTDPTNYGNVNINVTNNHYLQGFGAANAASAYPGPAFPNAIGTAAAASSGLAEASAAAVANNTCSPLTQLINHQNAYNSLGISPYANL